MFVAVWIGCLNAFAIELSSGGDNFWGHFLGDAYEGTPRETLSSNFDVDLVILTSNLNPWISDPISSCEEGGDRFVPLFPRCVPLQLLSVRASKVGRRAIARVQNRGGQVGTGGDTFVPPRCVPFNFLPLSASKVR